MAGSGVGAYGGAAAGLWTTGYGGAGYGTLASSTSSKRGGESFATPTTTVSTAMVSTGGTQDTATAGRPVGAAATAAGKALTAGEQSQVDQLKKRDAEVKAHEHAHQSAGGQFAGSPSYTYQKGPDGVNYAIGGEVSISTSAKTGDPAATIAQMRQVQRAALAPNQPSSQDLHVAAEAAQAIAKAQAEQSTTTGRGGAGTQGQGIPSDTATTGKSGAATRFQAHVLGAVAANSDGGVSAATGALTRGAAAYGAAVGLGANSQGNNRLAVVA